MSAGDLFDLESRKPHSTRAGGGLPEGLALVPEITEPARSGARTATSREAYTAIKYPACRN